MLPKKYFKICKKYPDLRLAFPYLFVNITDPVDVYFDLCLLWIFFLILPSPFSSFPFFYLQNPCRIRTLSILIDFHTINITHKFCG